MVQTIVPRPIAWVLSENENKSFNLAPFSYFNGVSSNPPLILLSVGKKPDGSFKDTRVNIETRSHFVVHIAHSELAADVTETSRSLATGESEFDLVNLETIKFEDFSLPRIKVCRVAYACKCYEVKEVGNTPQALILGLVKGVYLADDVAQLSQEGRLKVDVSKINPLSRLGGDEYATLGNVINIPRPK